MEYGGHPCRVALDDFPRFGVGEVFVAETSEVHRIFQRLAETVVFDIVFERLPDAGQFVQRFAVVGSQFA